MHVGSIVARLGLITVLVVIGDSSSPAPRHLDPAVRHAQPAFAWMDGVFGIQGTSNIFGVYEIVTGF
jgi:hypothetical protein